MVAIKRLHNQRVKTIIRQTQQQANDTRLLRHFTRKRYIASIMCSELKLEGANVLDATNKGNKRIDELAKALLHQYDIIGRYVWLTKCDSAEVINATAHHNNDLPMLRTLQSNTVPLWINSDKGLDIVSWKVMKQQLMRKRKARLMIPSFEAVARDCGDNVNDWYVCKTPIPTSHLSLDTQVWDDLFANGLNEQLVEHIATNGIDTLEVA